MNARDLLGTLLDGETFRSWDGEPVDARPGPAYAADLMRARNATGLDESVLTGEGLLAGHRIAVAAGEFGFLGGSIGVAAGERLTAAAERALRERLPFLVLPSSGGTRMQEGTIAFLQMVKITAAVIALKAAGLPYLVYLRHPTTGGVFASWASLGHVTLAEPGALIGFLGPRVYEALEGRRFPIDVQVAENLHVHGLVDAVVPVAGLRPYLDRVLAALAPGAAPLPAEPTPAQAGDGSSAWDSVLRTRAPGRPGAGDLIRTAATDVVTLRDGALILALGRVGGQPCVLAGQDRAVAQDTRALRLARRGMRLAADLRIPLVTVIDTPGAELSAAAEEDGIAGEIAECIATMLGLPVPTIAVLLGQGTGGGALALLPADRVIAAEHAWLAPLAPEGASAIVYKDTAHAADLAARQGILASSLATAGAVDRVVLEDGDFPRGLGPVLRAELASLASLGNETRVARRLRRYRDLGR
ncbi:MAG TPA: carboxyl transferase domain-containing protein [Trebonia sp.]|nr:carboxyl transferase domain-containing protein [Trebonia sp.]